MFRATVPITPGTDHETEEQIRQAVARENESNSDLTQVVAAGQEHTKPRKNPAVKRAVSKDKCEGPRLPISARKSIHLSQTVLCVTICFI
jgi:hypothetical protein